MAESPRPKRVALYTHDTFGMGHVRRAMNIIDALSAADPEMAILLISGSPALHLYPERAQNVDVVKLPTIAPTGSAGDRPPHLPIGTGKLIALRREMILTTLTHFAPDVFIVDNFALGARKELRPTLEALAPTRTRVMLSLRDIVDAPEKIRESWPRDGVIPALEGLYDDILVFGERAVFDLAQAYDLSAEIAAKMTYCGYIARSVPPASDARLAEEGVRAPFVLATVGGGGDGLPMARAVIAAAGAMPLPVLLVTGPLMGAAARAETTSGKPSNNLIMKDFIPDMPAFMARSELTISMAGYNTIAEVLQAGCRSVVAPRDWRFGEHEKGTAAGTEMEQVLRAENLAKAGRATLIAPGALSARALIDAVTTELARPRPEAGATAQGAARATEIIMKRLKKRR